MTKWVFGYLALFFVVFGLWIARPFIGIDDPISVDIAKAEVQGPLVLKTYDPPSDTYAGGAYRTARSRRMLADKAVYPKPIILRYNNALETQMDVMAGPYDEGAPRFPHASGLRNNNVLSEMIKTAPCQGISREITWPQGKNKPAIVQWVNADARPKSNTYVNRSKKCVSLITPRHISKTLQYLLKQNTRVRVSDCSWERVSNDAVVLDMRKIFSFKDNAAYLCLMTLESKSQEPYETAGYFAKPGNSGWIYLGGFHDVKLTLPRVRLDAEIMKNPEVAAQKRWSALAP